MPVLSADSAPITQWLDELRDGNEQSLGQLMSVCCFRMIHPARSWLRPGRSCSGALDSQMVVASAFHALYLGIRLGTLSRVRNRRGLWATLSRLVRNKAIDHLRHTIHGECPQTPLPHGDFSPPADGSGPVGIVESRDELARFFDSLENPTDRLIAYWDLQGYKDQEIADRLGSTRVTVSRHLREIRECWEEIIVHEQPQ